MFKIKRNILFIFLSLIAFSCDIFNPREAEEPLNSRNNYQLPVNPQDLITNLVFSLKDRDVENYLSCFSDATLNGKEFVFLPSGTELPSWGKREEEQYFNNLKNKLIEEQQIVLSLSKENYSSPQGDSLTYTASYNLFIPHNDPNLATNFQGELKMAFIRDSKSIWYIYNWQDIKTSHASSWTDLKRWFY